MTVTSVGPYVREASISIITFAVQAAVTVCLENLPTVTRQVQGEKYLRLFDHVDGIAYAYQ